MIHKNSNKKGKPAQEKPEANALEKEIDEMIDMEKAKSKIVRNLFYDSEATTSDINT